MNAQANYMPPEQFNQVLAAIPRLKIRKWKDEDIQMLFKILYWCALRFNEGVRLKVEDFDLLTNQIYLGKTKTNKEDYAPIPPSFKPELAVFLVGKTGPLFPGLTYKTAIWWIKRLGEMLEIRAWTTPQLISGEKTKTHIFRKSIAKDLLYGTYGAEAPLNIISKHLRHKGDNALAMTSHYIKADLQTVKDWWQKQTPKESDASL